MLNSRSVVLVGALTLSVLVVPVLGGPQGDPAENMPDGEGKGLVSSVCSTCHSLQQSLGQRKSRQGWEQTLDDMISRGAQIFPEEMEEIVNYLAQHYGTESSAPAATSPPAASQSTRMERQTQPSAGQELLTSKCFQCHGDGMWRDLYQSRRDWEATLYRMVGRGALWTEEEISGMADYLTEINGPK